MELKRKLFRYTGFDLFEPKDLLFLIPGSVAIPFFLLLSLFVRRKWEGKLTISFFAVSFVYALFFEVLNGVLTDIVPSATSGIVHFVIFSLANFLFSVAWLGFYRQLK